MLLFATPGLSKLVLLRNPSLFRVASSSHRLWIQTWPSGFNSFIFN